VIETQFNHKATKGGWFLFTAWNGSLGNVKIYEIMIMNTLKMVAAIAVSVSASVSSFAEELPTDIADVSAQSGIVELPMRDADISAQSGVAELPAGEADIIAQSGISELPTGEADIIAQSVIPEPNTDFTGIPELQGLDESESLFLDNLSGGKNSSLLKPKSK
jgi:hypothetical protein